MKNTKTIKAIALALLCTLLVGAAVGIGISAAGEDGTNVATIGMKNLAYNDKLNLAIELQQVKEGTLGLAVWKVNEEESYTAENIYFTNFNVIEGEVQGEKICYAFSHGIAAKDIETVYVFAAVVKDANGTLHIGQKIKYSVSDYLDERLADTTISTQQETLYKAVIAYGKAANGVLNAE